MGSKEYSVLKKRLEKSKQPQTSATLWHLFGAVAMEFELNTVNTVVTTIQIFKYSGSQ
jgi:hypothetical protein